MPKPTVYCPAYLGSKMTPLPFYRDIYDRFIIRITLFFDQTQKIWTLFDLQFQASLDDPTAQYHLAKHYANQSLNPRCARVLAYVWYQRALDHGVSAAKVDLESFTPELCEEEWEQVNWLLCQSEHHS